MHLRMGRMYLSFLLVLVVCAAALHAAFLAQTYFSMVEQARADREHVLYQQMYHAERYMQEW